uniref:Uncharacterized protein n=1 Tax=Graphocephala atropunctata TaxID=36148 RepID=A0A1B6L0I1_9HEMI
MSFKTAGLIIDGINTDIAVSEFVNSYFIVLTQFEKLGAIVSVKKDSFQAVEGEQTVYSIKTEFGDEEGPGQIVARYLVEQLNISKPVVFSVALRDSSLRTLRALTQALRTLNNWS